VTTSVVIFADVHHHLNGNIYSTIVIALFKLAASSWENASWREGTKRRLRSRFAAQRVRIAHRDYWRSELPAEEWLLIEWPTGANEPTKYWLSTLPAASKLVDLVRLAKHRWIIERDYEELKQDITKVAAGADFIITARCASPHTASW
jgi:SRSO17 transposase